MLSWTRMGRAMKFLIVDDHVLIRDALRGILGELMSDAVVAEASDSRQAMRFVAENADLQLVVLDLTLPDRNGLDVLAELREHYPAVSVVVLSALDDNASVVRALELGALGYIPKSAQRSVMISALQLVFSGGIYIPPEALGHRESAPSKAQLAPPQSVAKVSPGELGLTERQIDVLALMMQGKSNKAICRVLQVAEPTVKNHITYILKALKVTNRTEAVIAANAMGWDFQSVGRGSNPS